jgi:membrane protein DedA with SNARE-associated domain
MKIFGFLLSCIGSVINAVGVIACFYAAGTWFNHPENHHLLRLAWLFAPGILLQALGSRVQGEFEK